MPGSIRRDGDVISDVIAISNIIGAFHVVRGIQDAEFYAPTICPGNGDFSVRQLDGI